MYALITARGADAVSFLQGQLTQDLRRVSESHSPLAAWCTPKGRVIVVLRLLAIDDGIGLVTPAELAGTVVDGLLRYRLRARVELSVFDDDWHAYGIANATDLDLLKARGLLPGNGGGATARDRGVSVVRPAEGAEFVEVYAAAAALAEAGLDFVAPLSAEDWRGARIALGVADIVAATSGRYTPHMLNLDRLGAVSFDKGCYAGQEVVARTEHLGSSRRRLAHLRASAPLAVAERVELDGTSVGEVVSSAGQELLALLPVDLHDQKLRAGSVRLEPARDAA